METKSLVCVCVCVCVCVSQPEVGQGRLPPPSPAGYSLGREILSGQKIIVTVCFHLSGGRGMT